MQYVQAKPSQIINKIFDLAQKDMRNNYSK